MLLSMLLLSTLVMLATLLLQLNPLSSAYTAVEGVAVAANVIVRNIVAGYNETGVYSPLFKSVVIFDVVTALNNLAS